VIEVLNGLGLAEWRSVEQQRHLQGGGDDAVGPEFYHSFVVFGLAKSGGMAVLFQTASSSPAINIPFQSRGSFQVERPSPHWSKPVAALEEMKIDRNWT
jgi:hypothetical protein